MTAATSTATADHAGVLQPRFDARARGRQSAQRQADEGAGDEPADVAHLGDVRHREGEHEVEDDDGDQPLRVEAQLAHQDQAGAEQPEDRAGCARRRRVVPAEGVDRGAAAERAEQVQRAEPDPAEQLIRAPGRRRSAPACSTPMCSRLTCRNADVSSW